MSQTRCLITITDVIAPTSMPFNEFVLFRAKKFDNEKQVVLLLFKDKIDKNVSVPDNVNVYCIGKNIKLFKTVVKNTVKECEENDMDYVFHIHEAKSVLLFDFVFGGKYRNKTVFTVHSTFKNYSLKNKILCSLAVAKCRNVVCVGETSFRYFPSSLKKGNKVSFIQNGIDVDRTTHAYCADRTKNEKFVIVYVARFVPLKRHDMLIDIVSKLDDVQLFLIGKGPIEDNIKEQARLKADGKVVFLGAKPRDEVYRFFGKCDLYVSVSSYEGLPVSLLEALSCGLTCVVSDIEQHREVLAGITDAARLASTEEEFVKAINEIKNMSQSERAEFGQKCREYVNKHFSAETMNEQYNEIYNW